MKIYDKIISQAEEDIGLFARIGHFLFPALIIYLLSWFWTTKEIEHSYSTLYYASFLIIVGYLLISYSEKLVMVNAQKLSASCLNAISLIIGISFFIYGVFYLERNFFDIYLEEMQINYFHYALTILFMITIMLKLHSSVFVAALVMHRFKFWKLLSKINIASVDY